MEIPRDRVKLEDNQRLSPPFVVAPLYGCSEIVNVRGFLPNATLDVELDGAIVVSGFPGGFPEPVGAVVALAAALTPGQVVRARQAAGGLQSGWSSPVTVRDHTADHPAGPPRPEINPAPVYQCGSRTGVANLLTGCNVWITADGAEVGRVNGAVTHQGVNVTPDYGPNQQVLAWAELCSDPSPPSALQITQPPPTPLAAPTFEPLFEGSQQVTLNGLANGARFNLTRNGVNQGTFRAWGGRFTVNGIAPIVAGDVFSATQMLCPGDPPSPPGTETPRPCSALPAPVVAPIQAGDTTMVLLEFVPDARIRVYINGVKAGDGGGSVIVLTQVVRHGDTIDVLQSVGACVSDWVQEVKVQCVAPHITGDPTALNLFPVGSREYDGGTVSILGKTMHVRGSVYYPAQVDGTSTPFNDRLGQLGPVPVVVLVHGRHSASVPNYRGYDYFQAQLARMGMVAVSVDQNETVAGGGTTNIHERARLAIASIAYFQSLHTGGDPLFGGRLDLSRVGLMGHSRGGEAVVVIPEVPPPAGVRIRGVLSLAPVDFGASSGVPQGYAFMTILPAADGDVVDNNGARFYDKAHLDPYRCQLYVHFANHNFFNRQWTNDDALGTLPLMSRVDHERVLSGYGCAFFREVLLGHQTIGFLAGTELPSGVLTGNVQISFEHTRPFQVDNHEDVNGIGLNSLGRPTAQAGGLTADEHPFTQSAPGRFNDTFFGNTIGMVALGKEAGGTFRSELDAPKDLNGLEVWIRSAEVFDGSIIPPGATGFQLGLETVPGTVVWVDSDDVGGLPRPFDRAPFDALIRQSDPQWPNTTKTMPKTLRFRAGCFSAGAKLPPVEAIVLRLDRGDQRALAFDDLDIVTP
jgi:hypothetical protein